MFVFQLRIMKVSAYVNTWKLADRFLPDGSTKPDRNQRTQTVGLLTAKRSLIFATSISVTICSTQLPLSELQKNLGLHEHHFRITQRLLFQRFLWILTFFIEKLSRCLSTLLNSIFTKSNKVFPRDSILYFEPATLTDENSSISCVFSSSNLSKSSRKSTSTPRSFFKNRDICSNQRTPPYMLLSLSRLFTSWRQKSSAVFVATSFR